MIKKIQRLFVLIGISLIGLFQFGTVTYAADTNTATMQEAENKEQISGNVNDVQLSENGKTLDITTDEGNVYTTETDSNTIVDFDFFEKVKDKVDEIKISEDGDSFSFTIENANFVVKNLTQDQQEAVKNASTNIDNRNQAKKIVQMAIIYIIGLTVVLAVYLIQLRIQRY